MTNFKITLNNTEIDSDKIFPYVKNGEVKDAVLFMKEETGCSNEEAYKVYKELKQMINPKPLKQAERDILKRDDNTYQQSNIPHCPVCNSTNIEKISVGKKFKGSILFGIFSSDAQKTMYCKDCGYKF